jgi:hypothetical protein
MNRMVRMVALVAALLMGGSLLAACHGDTDGDGNADPFITQAYHVRPPYCYEGNLAIHHADGGMLYGWATYEEVRDNPGPHQSFWDDVHGMFQATQSDQQNYGYYAGSWFFFSDGRTYRQGSCAGIH